MVKLMDYFIAEICPIKRFSTLQFQQNPVKIIKKAILQINVPFLQINVLFRAEICPTSADKCPISAEICPI